MGCFFRLWLEIDADVRKIVAVKALPSNVVEPLHSRPYRSELRHAIVTGGMQTAPEVIVHIFDNLVDR
jgi:hypothetical protein